MLLDEIQRQTDLHFIFNTEQTNSLGKVSIEVRNESVEAVLIRLFEGTDLTYSFRGNIIVVKRREDTRGQQEMLKITGKVVDEKKQVLPGVKVGRNDCWDCNEYERSILVNVASPGGFSGIFFCRF